MEFWGAITVFFTSKAHLTSINQEFIEPFFDELTISTFPKVKPQKNTLIRLIFRIQKKGEKYKNDLSNVAEIEKKPVKQFNF